MFNTLFNLEQDVIQTEMILNKLCLCVMCTFLRVVVLAGWQMGLGLEMLIFFSFNIALVKVKVTQACLTLCRI